MKKLKRWQIPFFAFAHFGPCMLSTVISVYLVDALQVAGFGSDVENWTFAAKTIVAVGLFSVLKAISSLMDGLVEVPVATFVQNLKTPWGRKRPAILVGTIVMTASYVLFCFPLSYEENSVANSIYFGVLLTLFVSFFTFFSIVKLILSNNINTLLLLNHLVSILRNCSLISLTSSVSSLFSSS